MEPATIRQPARAKAIGDRIEEAAALAQERLPGDEAAAAAAFVRRFYANVAPEDIARTSPANLYGAAMALRGLAAQRTPGTPRVRAWNPRTAEDGWGSSHTVVQIVNDDMPFLVDSVTGELARHGITVHLLAHPVLAVERDGAGRLLRIERGAPLRESMMHIEVDAQAGADALRTLAGGIERVLADVRLAVDDWKPMLRRLAVATADVGAETDTDEEAAFLRWLEDANFTFLGYGEFGPEGLVPGTALGLLRGGRIAEPPAAADAPPIAIGKTVSRSTVHRAVHMDRIAVRRSAGGEHRFIGLYTSRVFASDPESIPLVRRKIAGVMARAGLPPGGHAEKALAHVLETFPRDELIQAGEDDLHRIGLGVVQLHERRRVALFERRDPGGRLVTAFVYVPRDRYDSALLATFGTILETAFDATVVADGAQIDDDPLARLHYTLRARGPRLAETPHLRIEAALAEAARQWPERLHAALVAAHGEELGNRLFRRYADAFPAGYRETWGADVAVGDIDLLETAADDGLAVGLYRPVEAPETSLRFKVCRRGAPMALSDALPLLENLGLRVVAETPHRVRPAPPGGAEDGAPRGGDEGQIWLHDLEMTSAAGRPIDLHAVKPAFEDAFRQLWHGEIENDGFNRLVLAAGLDARQTVVLRTFARYLRQVGIPFSQPYMEETLAAHPDLAAAIVRLFEAGMRPAGPDAEAVGRLESAIAAGLDAVGSLDEDRILRRFLNLVEAALRTNYFQRGEDGRPQPYLSIKFDCARVDDLPLPRPLYEIFVYSPRMEGIHLRGGKVARGGIRWSDRREDFRTEILGLMKAQMVKNAVIVPVGSKGGFVVKRPPADPSREAQRAEGVECYRMLLRGMLDITDDYDGGTVVPPREVHRRDGDDPYLVVAADKGTADFSDIANALAADYGFWLDDAFASGGSAGYDHKGMGITARGAWEGIKRHFRELGTDIQATAFDVVGVGDMSGDVFGNGMLLSPHIRLVAAFDHRHVFVDPSPDPAAGLAERERLFALPRSSWADYDADLISAGGGVFPRTAKSIAVTPQMAARLDIEAAHVTPNELIRAILAARADLLYFGGIGTYVKARGESHGEVGDRTNDAVRVDGADLRARVVGEGANLAVTQRGRVEYATAGGRIDTDFIDNSAGVDTSDHEVNLKILLAGVEADGDITRKQRDQILRSMTDDVAALVLRDNYQQTLALTVAEHGAADALMQHRRFMRTLERQGRLNRRVEFLPDDAALADRAAARRGLTRPELAVLLAYAKMTLYRDVIETDLPDEPELSDMLVHYFPEAVRTRFADRLDRHRLRREIACTQLVNSLVNRAGIVFVQDQAERTAQPAAQVARAFAVVRNVFDLRRLWQEIEALDNRVDAAHQTHMIEETRRLLTRGCRWFLAGSSDPIDVAGCIGRFRDGIIRFSAVLDDVLAGDAAADFRQRCEAWAEAGVPAALARRVAALAPLAAAPEVVRIAAAIDLPVEAVARTHFAAGERFHVERLRRLAGRIATSTPWEALAVDAALEDLDSHQARITAFVARRPDGSMEGWAMERRALVDRLDRLVGEVEAAERPELAMLTVAGGALRALATA